MCCCVGDEGLWPFGVARRREAPNHLMLRWLMTVVVSDGEKAPGRCQVGTRKTNASESLLTCRNRYRRHRNRGVKRIPGQAWRVCRLLARWCPACRRREPGLRLPCGTGEGVPGYALFVRAGERECPKRRHRKGLSTVAGRAGGPVRSSDEGPVTGPERRGRVVRGWSVRSTGCSPGGVAWAS